MPHQCTNCGRTFADGSKEMLSGCPDCDGTKFQFSPDGFDDLPDPAAEPPERPDRPGEGVGGTVGTAAATVRDLVRGSAGPDATDAAPPDSDSDPPRDTPTAGPGDPTTAGASDDGDDDIIVAESQEDTAQADARSQVAGPDDLPDGEGDTDGHDEYEGEADLDEGTPTGAASDAAASGEAPVTEDDAGTPGDADADRTVAEEPDAETADRPDLAQLRRELNDQFESIRIVERGQYELNLMELYDRDEVIVALQEDGRYSIRVPEAIGEADV